MKRYIAGTSAGAINGALLLNHVLQNKRRNKTLELFQKPFDYLFKGEYISPQQKAELRQMAIDEGIIATSTPIIPQTIALPKGTYT